MPRYQQPTRLTPTSLVYRFFRTKKGQEGTAMIEFALIAPALLAIICGILEFSGVMVAQTLLEGGARQASRFGILGSSPNAEAGEAAIQQIIRDNSFGVIDAERVEIVTLAYDSFGAVGQPEPFEDENGNGSFDPNEAFSDINGNGSRDEDQGAAGLGNPDQVVLYRVSYDWDVMVPLFEPIFGEQIALEASIAVRNEPSGS